MTVLLNVIKLQDSLFAGPSAIWPPYSMIQKLILCVNIFRAMFLLSVCDVLTQTEGPKHVLDI